MSTIATNCKQARQQAEADVPDPAAAALSSGSNARQVLATEFDHLHAQVYRYLLHRCFNPELAEELTAQTFYKAATFIGRRRGDIRQVRAWLLRTATNLANTHYRRKRLRQFFLNKLTGSTTETTEPEPRSDSPDGQRRARVRGALLALRPKYQTVVVLRYYAQMSYADIADVLGCRQDAVRARLSRAIEEMRQRLGPDGSPDSSSS